MDYLYLIRWDVTPEVVLKATKIEEGMRLEVKKSHGNRTPSPNFWISCILFVTLIKAILLNNVRATTSLVHTDR
jgi:hypothetical protein